MLSTYLIYFNTLSNEQKVHQVFMLLIFFLSLFAICGLLEFLRTKYLNKAKNNNSDWLYNK
jgi:hypothetical protein